jgi:glycosyltransferase involved in cell wall biosynthesis
MHLLKNLFPPKKKVIFIPFQKYNYVGGPSTFMHNLKYYLDSQQYVYTNNHINANAIFFPISFHLDQLEQFKTSKRKIIQRLDGIYYKEKHGDNYVELNADIERIYSDYADHVVFQSAYCKRQCFKLFGVKEADTYSIIKNGVNTNIFYPSTRNLNLADGVKFITTGNFRNIDMLEPVILALDSITSFKFQLTIVGPVVNEDLKPFLQRDYVVFKDKQELSTVATLLREAHIFIYSHLNPPCPNSVLEASACGLPVVGFNSGSMSELLHFATDLLAPVSDDIFQKYEDFDYQSLKDKIEMAVENYSNYKELAIKYCKENEFKICGARYIDLFNKLLS